MKLVLAILMSLSFAFAAVVNEDTRPVTYVDGEEVRLDSSNSVKVIIMNQNTSETVYIPLAGLSAKKKKSEGDDGPYVPDGQDPDGNRTCRPACEAGQYCHVDASGASCRE